MTSTPPGPPRVLIVGGTGGLVGRNLLREFAPDHRVRSIHRHPTEIERAAGVERIEADIASFSGWQAALRDVDLVVNVAWHRSGPGPRFVALCDGLLRMLEAAKELGISRFVQISVPAAPPHLERSFPYLTEKRRFDAALAQSGLSYRILRPTMLFGPGDVLIEVMVRSIRRYPAFPMFGDGRYHVSPLAAADLARIVRREAALGRTGTLEVGGPRRYEYRELTDLLFETVGKRPRYWRMSGSSGVRLARLMEAMGSHRLYAYEVEWLLEDRLGLAPYEGLPGGLQDLSEYLARRWPAPNPRVDAPPVGP
jgi:uncharacterized protein YbjT (DUF2867 family)